MSQQRPPRIGLIIIGDEILSGKREDQHLKNANAILRPRGLQVDWVRILGDEGEFLTENFLQTLYWSAFEGDIVFSFGGIGATPDDRTRQSAAKALGRAIERHPEAVKEIEAQYGADAYPKRVLMAEYPQGAKIIPNPFNRVPGFSLFFKCPFMVDDDASLKTQFLPEVEMPIEPKYGEDYCGSHHFMPGFPRMAKPMMEWVIDHYYKAIQRTPTVEKAIRLVDGQESDWIDFMTWFETEHPELRLFSLPKIHEDNRRSIELGVEGPADRAEEGLKKIKAEAEKRGHTYEEMADRQAQPHNDEKVSRETPQQADATNAGEKEANSAKE